MVQPTYEYGPSRLGRNIFEDVLRGAALLSHGIKADVVQPTVSHLGVHESNFRLAEPKFMHLPRQPSESANHLSFISARTPCSFPAAAT